VSENKLARIGSIILSLKPAGGWICKHCSFRSEDHCLIFKQMIHDFDSLLDECRRLIDG
jgi:hypothetical protein